MMTATKRKSTTSPTQRTLTECRRRGWEADVVEKWIAVPKSQNPAGGFRRDLFGVIDVVAIADGQLVGIQACAAASGSTRANKAAAEPRVKLWLQAGARFEVWGWTYEYRGKVKRWFPLVKAFALENGVVTITSDDRRRTGGQSKLRLRGDA